MISYINLSNRFFIDDIDFNTQYFKIYQSRLNQMSELLKSKIIQKWDNKYPIVCITKVKDEKMEKSVIVGTLFKDQKLKPSILKQILNFHQLDNQPIIKDKLLSDTDCVFLERSDQRYLLIGEFDNNSLVTGITCGVLGRDAGNYKFIVDDFCFAGYPLQVPRNIPENDLFVLFVSGLDLFNSTKTLLPFQECIEWLKSRNDLEKFAHLIIAGNSVSTQETKEKNITLWSRDKLKEGAFEAIDILDDVLRKLLDVIDVSLMPGQFDPSDSILPQQPMHKCMFTKSFPTKRLHLVTNPYNFQLNGTKFLGTSGQNVDDIRKYCNYTKPIEIMEHILEWSHLAPTCPDTLGGFPLSENDPFIIDDCPHVFFTGNQQEFDQKLFVGNDGQNVLLLSLPCFSQSLTVVKLNLRNFECTLKTFDEINFDKINSNYNEFDA